MAGRAYINGGLWVVQPSLKIGGWTAASPPSFARSSLHATQRTAGEYLWELMVEGWPEVHPNGTYDESRPRAMWRVADQVRRRAPPPLAAIASAQVARLRHPQDIFRFAFSDWEWRDLNDRPSSINYAGGFPKASATRAV